MSENYEEDNSPSISDLMTIYEQRNGLSLDFSGLETNWDFQDEFTATNDLTIDAYPRSSSPLPDDLKPKFLINFDEWLFDEKNEYSNFESALKSLPTDLKVRGVDTPPPLVLSGFLSTGDSYLEDDKEDPLLKTTESERTITLRRDYSALVRRIRKRLNEYHNISDRTDKFYAQFNHELANAKTITENDDMPLSELIRLMRLRVKDD